MRLAFAIVLVVHGLIHLLGVAKAFELAELPELTWPIQPLMGLLWLAAALLFLLTAGALFVWPRWWWVIGFVAIAVSMVAIVPSWADAKFGALANLLLLAGIVFGFLADGPVGQRAAYEREVERRLTRSATDVILTEADVVAELSFNDAGELTNFWSDDRRRTSPDGRTMTAIRWSRPIGAIVPLAPSRLASRGEGRWHAPGGEYA
jgi:Family of unknown function (DUF6544)